MRLHDDLRLFTAPWNSDEMTIGKTHPTLYCRVNDNLVEGITGINAWDVFNLIIRIPGRIVVALK